MADPSTYSEAVSTAREYYNSSSAENFYSTIWGGEDIHVGIYQGENDSIFDASQRTVEKIAEQLKLDPSTTVLDIGAGYGGSARYLVKTYGCPVDCLNLSEVQNERNRKLNQEQGVADKIDVYDGDFEALPMSDASYDVVWCQDSILHSSNREKVLEEAYRVLKPGGEFIFTDPMQSDDCNPEEIQPVLDRIHLPSMGSVGFYRQVASRLGFDEVQFIDMSEQIPNHYGSVLKAVNENYDATVKQCGTEYVENMRNGLNHWVNFGKQGKLKWGILHFRKR
jgi:sarcosine/dimethylglycine N-methyltransferase